MTQRDVRELLSTRPKLTNLEEKVDEGLAGAGRRLRMRKLAEVHPLDPEEKRLKDLGMFEEGMSREQRKQLLSVVDASKQSATMEQKSRQIGDKLDYNAGIDLGLFNFDHNDIELVNASHPVATDNSKQSTSPSPIFFSESIRSPDEMSQVPGSPDILVSIAETPERQIKDAKNDTAMKRPESTNKGALSSDLPLVENVHRKYDRLIRLWPIDPHDFIEDHPIVSLIDKRKHTIRDTSSWSTCCPDGVQPKDFAMSLKKNLEKYHEDLYKLQRSSLDFLEWGKPVAMGRHYPGTLDVWRPKLFSKAYEDLEEETQEKAQNKDEDEMRKSGSEDEFDNLVKTGESGKRKFNFKSKIHTYSSNAQKKPVDSKKDIYSFAASSDEEDPVKENRTSKPQKKSSSENESEEYIPDSQPAVKKRRPLKLGQSNVSTSQVTRALNVFGRKFYGTSASQALDVHHISEDQRPKSAAPKQTTNLQEVLKPSLKVVATKVGLGRKWLSKDGGMEQPMGAPGTGNSCDEIEIVDAFAKKNSVQGVSEDLRKKSRPIRKLAKLANYVISDADCELDSERAGQSSSKRIRLDNLMDSISDETYEQNGAEEAIRTLAPSPDISALKSKGVQPQDNTVPCPLCGNVFALSQIEEHASDCQGEQEETPSWMTTRTPKNKYRCYICQGVFDPDSYNGHVIACVARKRAMEKEMPMEPMTPDPTDADLTKLQKESFGHSLLSRLDTPKIGAATRAKTFNCIAAESPLADTRVLHLRSMPSSHIDDGDISMAHVSTPTFQMFKPISQLKDSLIDFKNQFPVAHHVKKQRVAKKVKTKKRKKSFKGRKSMGGRKSQ